jgi:hypothetical protein
MWQDGEDGFTPRTLDAPDGHSTQTDAHIMGVARQAPASATGRLVFQLKAEGENESEHEFNKGLAVAKQLNIGRFVSKTTVMVRFSRVRLAAVLMCHPRSLGLVSG